EPLRGGPQGQLGVDAEAPCEVDEREQRLSEPELRGLADRFVVQALARLGAAEARGYRPPLDLPCVEQRRQVLRHVRERLAGAPSLLLALDPVPVPQHFAGGLGLGVPEHVWMAADQLLRHSLGDLREAAGAALLEQKREEMDLE